MHRTGATTAQSARRTRGRLVAVAVALASVVAGLAGVAPPVGAAPVDRPSGVAPVDGPAGVAPSPGFGADGIPVRPASERYVRESYRALLGRDAEESGLAYWGGRLDGGTSREVFAREMALSRESVRAALRKAYDTSGRVPTAAELDEGTAAIREGAATVESVLVGLLASDEHDGEEGSSSDAGFVDALYSDVLGRPADAAGAEHWLGRLEGGATRTTVAEAFVRSSERLRRLVEDSYDRILGRASDTGGRDHWVDRMRRGEGHLDIDAHLLASDEAWGSGCSTLDETRCLLPFPNDELTMADASTDTGRRVVFKSPWLPAPVNGPAFDPREWNRQDGFSPGSALLVHSAGIDPVRSGVPPLIDIGASLELDSPIVVVDIDTGERWPFWAELDANAPDDVERALIIRPARNFLDGHRYAVGIGPMVDAAGEAVPTPPGFQVFRDELPSRDREVNERRPLIEEAIDVVVGAGLERSELHLAWSFTVASTRNLAERAVHMRDEVLGGPSGLTAPDFTVTGAERRDDGTTRVAGTFEVPLYLTGTGAPGSRLNDGDDDLPEQNGTSTAPFVCTVPDSSRTDPARPSLYGHGLLGTGGQANSGYVRDVAREHNTVFCGTDYIGMSESDLPNTVGIIADLSRFPELVDRNQQGLLNFQVLGRLMTLPDGLGSDPAFQGDGGASVVSDEVPLQYYGLSQGGIMGGALVALSTDITRGVLGVPAINYSTLLERSVDFDPFFAIMAGSYPSALDRLVMISVIQMLWDRGEGNGYANHVTSDPLPGTPTHEVLLQPAFGDHQVTQYATEVQARTYGASTNDPPLAEGRVLDVEPLWGIERIETWPHEGSAIIYWDSGTPAPPTPNVPPRPEDGYGEDPHGDPRDDPDARRQIDAFLQADGVVIDVCDGSFCVADGA